MNIVLAFDSFKESMTSMQAVKSVQSVLTDHHCILLPLCDGGEGTLDILINLLNGTLYEFEVHDVFMNKRTVKAGIAGDKAIIESAKVIGLELTDGIRNPHITTTYGLGELIIQLLDYPIKEIIVTLGGSATNDGGVGMLKALGVHFIPDKQYMLMDDLKDIEKIDISHLDDRLKDIDITVLCDVDNPLYGTNGATYTYGLQKGLKHKELEDIDSGMINYSKKTSLILNSDAYFLGTGAAGGLGFAFKYYLNADIKSGFKTVSELTDLEDKIKHCDIVFVGEGKMDVQTLHGKTPFGVLNLAKKYHKPVYGFAGIVEDHQVLIDAGFRNLYEISKGIDRQQCIQHGEYYLAQCVLKYIKEIEDDVYSR